MPLPPWGLGPDHERAGRAPSKKSTCEEMSLTRLMEETLPPSGESDDPPTVRSDQREGVREGERVGGGWGGVSSLHTSSLFPQRSLLLRLTKTTVIKLLTVA